MNWLEASNNNENTKWIQLLDNKEVPSTNVPGIIYYGSFSPVSSRLSSNSLNFNFCAFVKHLGKPVIQQVAVSDTIQSTRSARLLHLFSSGMLLCTSLHLVLFSKGLSKILKKWKHLLHNAALVIVITLLLYASKHIELLAINWKIFYQSVASAFGAIMVTTNLSATWLCACLHGVGNGGGRTGFGLVFNLEVYLRKCPAILQNQERILAQWMQAATTWIAQTPSVVHDHVHTCCAILALLRTGAVNFHNRHTKKLRTLLLTWHTWPNCHDYTAVNTPCCIHLYCNDHTGIFLLLLMLLNYVLAAIQLQTIGSKFPSSFPWIQKSAASTELRLATSCSESFSYF